MRTPDRVAGGGLFMVELLALASAIYGAWYCGELPNRRSPARADAEAGSQLDAIAADSHQEQSA